MSDDDTGGWVDKVPKEVMDRFGKKKPPGVGKKYGFIFRQLFALPGYLCTAIEFLSYWFFVHTYLIVFVVLCIEWYRPKGTSTVWWYFFDIALSLAAGLEMTFDVRISGTPSPRALLKTNIFIKLIM